MGALARVGRAYGWCPDYVLRTFAPVEIVEYTIAAEIGGSALTRAPEPSPSAPEEADPDEYQPPDRAGFYSAVEAMR